jgi:glycosyltransferase involved in cell wall biosynthesis
MNINSPKISVIIPVFNAEKYLAKCMDSVLDQTFADIEVICVNDASPDNSGKILDKYAKKDPRVKVIKFTENQGQSAGRNAAMKIARGKYIGFVDSDDWIDSDFYEKLFDAAESSNSDIATAGIKSVTGDASRIWSQHKRGTFAGFSKKISRLGNGSPCDKIFLADMLKKHNITFPEGLYWEDNMFVLKAVWFSDKMAFVPDTFYNYVSNFDSTTKSPEKEAKRVRDNLTVCSMMMDFAHKTMVSNADIHQVKIFAYKGIWHLLIDKSYFRQTLVQIFGRGVVIEMRIRRRLKRTWKRVYKDYTRRGVRKIKILTIPIYIKRVK